ncbi:MAG: hypothetical protein A3I72_06735 [Candidatus Tectomicrobia bacterium RIFCSPLOWO2_02_FULL_70_19]|nr:MAG: hypothetical protein A3I72_06735 [Candidatus Tectomicrobia bacterium RIFCSPLOWO2_02_FULL_70_19]
MTPRLYHLITAAVFSVVAIFHAARIVFGWPAVIGGWAAPMGLSWAAFFISALLAWWGFRLGGR